MKVKRFIFIGSLIALFVFCYYQMNKDYNELARYPYATEENRDIILKYLDTNDINYLTAQQIEPKDFLPFIEEEGFNIHNTLWYSKAKNAQDGDPAIIVSFINAYRDRMSFDDLSYLLSSYSYETLREFYSKGDPYIKEAAIIVNPNAKHLVIVNRNTLYTFRPSDLERIAGVPFANIMEGRTEIYVKNEVRGPLSRLCDAASEINSQTCGNMIVTTGYLSYEDQTFLYEQALLEHGQDDVLKYAGYPGQSEFQLGYSVQLSSAEEADEEEVRKQETWLKENAYKYGFIIRYPQGKEAVTGKEGNSFILRYVGNDIAKEMQDKGVTLNEMVFHEQ